MAIRAIGYKALLRPDAVKKQTKSGIVLAVDERMEANAQVLGTVIELGEDFAAAYKPKTPYWGLKPGDHVYYARYAGKWVVDPDTREELLMVNDEDICAKVEGSVLDEELPIGPFHSGNLTDEGGNVTKQYDEHDPYFKKMMEAKRGGNVMATKEA